MLSLRILGVSNVLLPHQADVNEGNPSKRRQRDRNHVLWAVQVTNGSQQHRTQFVELPEARGDGEKLDGHKALWEEEVEIADKGDQETVEIALLFDLAPKTTLGRRLFRHSITTIELRTFRSQPERRIELWQPLRSVASQVDADLGKIHMAVIYSDDGGDQGYLFALFCGLFPSINFLRLRS